MNKRTAITFLVITLMSTISSVNAQKNNQSANFQLIDEFKILIRDKMQQKHLVGVGAALILGDSVIWKEGFGYADKENNIPFTTQTALRIGSITKPFTVIGIMQLHEKKLLNINKPLVEYLPEFSIKTRKTKINEITVKSVIQHTSGIPNEIYLNAWADNENYTNTVSYLKNEYLGYPVNMVYHYSNIGYCLLGHTILKVSQQEYPFYIQDNILKPIGMHNSGFRDYCELKNESKTYDTAGMYVPLKKYRHIPSGLLYSTIDDMIKFAQEIIAIYNGKKCGFLKPETLKIFEETNNDNIENINTALGWAILKNDSSLIIMHSGSDYVSNAVITIDLKKRIAAIFFVNTVGGLELTNAAGEKFWELSGIKSTDQVHPYQYKNKITNDISTDLLKSHTGLYVNTRDCNIVKFENDKLTLNSVYGNFQLKPQTNDEFLPGIIRNLDSIQWLTKPRFIFNEVKGYKFLFWQDVNYKRQPLGILEIPRAITQIWKNRLGKYIIDGYEIKGWDIFSEVDLSIADNNLLQLKVFYTSGEYVYYLRIENDNELVYCGFGETGGETISFSKANQKDIMIMYGLTLKKVE